MGRGKSWKSNLLSEYKKAKRSKVEKNNRQARKHILISVKINTRAHFIRHNMGKYLK
jgi:hypothetical protein